jgi:hypothetical protein
MEKLIEAALENGAEDFQELESSISEDAAEIEVRFVQPCQ